MEPVIPPKRDLLFRSRGRTHRVLGNEGAERRHLANLAVLAKDIIAFSCLFLPPFCKRLLPPQHKPGEERTLLALPTHGYKTWSCCQLPLTSISKLQNLHCSGRSAEPAPLRVWGVLSCLCQRCWCSCLYPMDQLPADNLQGRRKTSFSTSSTRRPSS